MLSVLKAINLGVAFLLELCMLAALGYWGFRASDNIVIRLLLGFGIPIIAILMWARFMAPRSATRLKGMAYIGLKSVLYGIAAVALAVAGQITPAVIFVCVAVISQALAILWKQEDAQPAQVEA